MSNKLISGIIGLAIAIIMVALVLTPVIVDVNDTERTLINNPVSNSNYSVIKTPSDDETHTITWVPKSDKMYVDDTAVTVGAYNSYMTISNVIAVNVSRSGAIGYNTVETPLGAFDESVTLVTVTIEGSTITLTADGTNPINVVKTGVEWYALPDSDGVYKLTQQASATSGKVYNLNSIDQIYGAMNVTTNSLGWVTFAGNVAYLPDGTKESMFWDYEKDDRYVDLYVGSAYNGYYLNPDYLTNADSSVIAPYFMLIPTEISVHTDQQSSILSIVNMIPVMVLLAIVVAAIGIIRFRD